MANAVVSVRLVVGALVLVMVIGGATAAPLCRIDTNDLEVCRPAVSPVYGRPLALPTDACCGVVRRADLTCLCNLKSLLPALGINPANALALPSKCGLHTPSQCNAP